MLIILYIVYRVLSLSVNPMLRTYINLSKQHRLCLRKKLPGLTSTICRNFEFYQNDTKIRWKLAYEMYSLFSFWGLRPQTPWPGGLRPPDPLTRGSAPGPRWGHSPQTPIIGSCYRARHSPPNPKTTKLRLCLLLIDVDDKNTERNSYSTHACKMLARWTRCISIMITISPTQLFPRDNNDNS